MAIVAEVVEENSSQKMPTFHVPPILTVNKSAAYESMIKYLTTRQL